MSGQTEPAVQEPLFNPFSPEFVRDPYPSYHKLREQMPLFKAPIGSWVASRYEDVSRILRDRKFGKDFEGQTKRRHGEDIFEKSKVYNGMRHWMLIKNPPDHTRLRGLVARVFAPKELQKLKPRIQSLVDGLLDRAEDNGKMDFIKDFAYPLPLDVICDMLGIEQQDREQFYSGSKLNGRLIDPTPLSPDEMAEIEANNDASRDYFNNEIEKRRQNPSDDMMSLLIHAEEAGDKLSSEELIANVALLFGAGHETTVNLIGNGMLALFSNPEQWDRLKADPDLVPRAIEEMLRFDSSVQLTSRCALEDVEVGGVNIPAGENVICLLGAANRDPDKFGEPDAFDVGRPDVKPMSFGGGIHFCVGAPLARMEAEIAFRTLIKRLPNIRLGQESEPEWRPTFTLRGLVSMPVVW